MFVCDCVCVVCALGAGVGVRVAGDSGRRCVGGSGYMGVTSFMKVGE